MEPVGINCDEVIEGRVWVGGYLRVDDVRLLRQMGITGVLNLQSEQDLNYYGIQMEPLLNAYRKAAIEMRWIPVLDFDKEALMAGLPRAVAELETLLSRPESRVYVHCSAGINRSPTLAAAYLIKARGLTAKDAYDRVVSHRYCNPYLDILEAYEASADKKSSGA